MRLQPFADVCIEANQFDDALQYIEKFSNDDSKIEYYIKIQCVHAPVPSPPPPPSHCTPRPDPCRHRRTVALGSPAMRAPGVMQAME